MNKYNKYKRIKDLCVKTTATHPAQVLDNVATTIFKTEPNDDVYILSKEQLPDELHKVKVDKNVIETISALDYKNEDLPTFSDLGPNEKYLVHKIFYSPYNLIYVVGGIGVGKTTFSKYFISKLLPDFEHKETHDKTNCPCVVYLDLRALFKTEDESNDNRIAQNNFKKVLSLNIHAKISEKNYFNINEEVETVWNHLLYERNHDQNRNLALYTIRTALREYELEEITPEIKLHIIAKRKEVRRAILDSEYCLDYFAALLQYIKSRYYDGHTPCFLIIIDNVDRVEVPVQRSIEDVIYSFTQICDVKVIYTVRQSTYHQGTIDDFSGLIDSAPYYGAVPLEVIYSRLDNFISKGAIFEKCRRFYTEDGLNDLAEKLRVIKDKVLRGKDEARFTVFFNSLCGHSVRKGLMLAQNLIYNSVYDPLKIVTSRDGTAQSADQKNLRMGDIIRALIVGINETYTYNSAGVVENIFQTQGEPKVSLLIKLRILKALQHRGSDGLKVDRLRRFLNYFGYSIDLIIASLNEMLSTEKRLIWTDTAPTFFTNEEDLIQKKSHAVLFLNSIGEGYITFLYNNVDYIQEVMLDTYVDVADFGSINWNYNNLVHRFTLVLRFCEHLLKEDVKEVGEFVYKATLNEYERAFGERSLISREILERVSKDVNVILEFVSKNSKGDYNAEIVEFASAQYGAYESKIKEARELEKSLFKL